MKRLLFILPILFLGRSVSAEQTKTLYNPFTGKLDYITSLNGISCNTIKLVDSLSANWYVSVDATGHLVTSSSSSSSSCAEKFNSLALRDSGGTFWRLTIDTAGHLVTSSGGAAGVISVLLADPSSVVWILSVDTGGHLVTS